MSQLYHEYQIIAWMTLFMEQMVPVVAIVAMMVVRSFTAIRWLNPSAFSDVAGICDSGKENYNDTSSQATDAGIQWDIAFDETGRRLEGRKYFGKKKRI